MSVRNKRKPRGYWTLERCKEEALQFTGRLQWKTASRSSYAIALKNEWFEECTMHMSSVRHPRSYWTVNNCHKEALSFLTRSQWAKEHPVSYSAARKMQIMDTCCSHMHSDRLKQGTLTLEYCKYEALKFGTRYQWYQEGASSYVAAARNGWLDQCCGHMKHAGGSSKPEKEILQHIKKYYPSAKSCWFGHIQRGIYGQRFQLDIYVPEINKGIEFNGTYWHGVGFHRNWTDDPDVYHKAKKQFFSDLGISYIEISESGWHNNKRYQTAKVLKFLSSSVK